MKLSMWNIYIRLSYKDIHAMINSTTPTISCARWIVSSTMKSDVVYIGSAEDFFDHGKGSAIIVHRKDMILVRDADPEELFDEVCDIIDEYMDWDRKLMACIDMKDGLQRMIDVSEDIFHNPAFIYDSKGDILAISARYPGSLHWHWQELLQNNCVTDRRIRYMQQEINLDLIFQDCQASRRFFDDVEYIHSSLFANRFAAGHYVLFDFNQPFTPGTEELLDNLINWMNIYLMKHCEDFSPVRQQNQIFLRMIEEGYQDPAGVDELSRYFNASGAHQYRIMVVQEQVNGEPVFLTRTYMRITERFPDLLVVKQERRLILLGLQGENCKMHGVLDYMLHHNNEQFLIGISNEFADLSRCQLYYRQALEELNRCSAEQVSYSLGEDHLEDYLRALISKDALGLTYAEQIPMKLMAYDQDNGTSLYETFKIYALCYFHKNETANNLDIHRNTLNYRLEKIEELLGADILNKLIQEYNAQRMSHMVFSFYLIEHAALHLCNSAQISDTDMS